VYHTDDVSDAELTERLESLGADRLRCLTAIDDGLAATAHRLDVAIDRMPVSADPDVELPRWVREQAISETTHRYGLLRPKSFSAPFPVKSDRKTG
jgi:hypothetical protein